MDPTISGSDNKGAPAAEPPSESVVPMPSSSSDVSLAFDNKVMPLELDDAISSTTADKGAEQSAQNSPDTDVDMFGSEFGISDVRTEKVTEDVEDIVQDLENLLGETEESFNYSKKVERVSDHEKKANPCTSVEVEVDSPKSNVENVQELPEAFDNEKQNDQVPEEVIAKDVQESPNEINVEVSSESTSQIQEVPEEEIVQETADLNEQNEPIAETSEESIVPIVETFEENKESAIEIPEEYKAPTVEISEENDEPTIEMIEENSEPATEKCVESNEPIIEEYDESNEATTEKYEENIEPIVEEYEENSTELSIDNEQPKLEVIADEYSGVYKQSINEAHLEQSMECEDDYKEIEKANNDFLQEVQEIEAEEAMQVDEVNESQPEESEAVIAEIENLPEEPASSILDIFEEPETCNQSVNEELEADVEHGEVEEIIGSPQEFQEATDELQQVLEGKSETVEQSENKELQVQVEQDETVEKQEDSEQMESEDVDNKIENIQEIVEEPDTSKQKIIEEELETVEQSPNKELEVTVEQEEVEQNEAVTQFQTEDLDTNVEPIQESIQESETSKEEVRNEDVDVQNQHETPRELQKTAEEEEMVEKLDRAEETAAYIEHQQFANENAIHQTTIDSAAHSLPVLVDAGTIQEGIEESPVPEEQTVPQNENLLQEDLSLQQDSTPQDKIILQEETIAEKEVATQEEPTPVEEVIPQRATLHEAAILDKAIPHVEEILQAEAVTQFEATAHEEPVAREEPMLQGCTILQESAMVHEQSIFQEDSVRQEGTIQQFHEQDENMQALKEIMGDDDSHITHQGDQIINDYIETESGLNNDYLNAEESSPNLVEIRSVESSQNVSEEVDEVDELERIADQYGAYSQQADNLNFDRSPIEKVSEIRENLLETFDGNEKVAEEVEKSVADKYNDINMQLNETLQIDAEKAVEEAMEADDFSFKGNENIAEGLDEYIVSTISESDEQEQLSEEGKIGFAKEESKSPVQPHSTTEIDPILIESSEDDSQAPTTHFVSKQVKPLTVDVDSDCFIEEVPHQISKERESLKITITKNKTDNEHSILKIYDPKEEEQSVPKLKIRSTPQSADVECITLQESVSKEGTIPKLTIKTISTSPHSPRHAKVVSSSIGSPIKLTIKPVKPSEGECSKEDHASPRRTMKPMAKSSEQSAPRITIKPIVKPDDEDDLQRLSNSPRLVIKPIKNPDEQIVEATHSPKITIKPIKNPDEQIQESTHSPKITIKPIVKPDNEDSKTEAVHSPKITIKPVVKPPEEPASEIIDYEEQMKPERIVLKIQKNTRKDKETEKLEKLRVKLSKQKGVARIVSTRSVLKRAREAELEKEKKSMRTEFANDVSSVSFKDESSSSDDIEIVGVIQPAEETDPLADVPDHLPFDLPTENVIIERSSTPPKVPAVPKKRGRPRKIPLVAREDFKDVAMRPVYESTRPKRSCRGTSVTATLGIKPRKPRGPGSGRGRGGKRTSLTREELKEAKEIEETQEPKLSPSKVKLLKQSLLKKKCEKKEVEFEIKPEQFEFKSIPVPVFETSTSSDVVMIEEETRMSSESNSRAQTPAKQVLSAIEVIEESQSSIQSTATENSEKAQKLKKASRLEIHHEPEGEVISADKLAEYSWGGGGPYMLQEQVAQFLGIKSFKRKYPGIQRRPVDMQERDFIRESGLASEAMCDMGLTAVRREDILDIMYADFQQKYEEYCKHQRDRQAKEVSNKQKALTLAASQEKNKLDMVEQAVQSCLSWNNQFNRARKDGRRACMDLQTLTVHYPKGKVKQVNKPPVGTYPVSVVPGQFCDYYKTYTPEELGALPLNTIGFKGITLPPEPEDSQSDGTVSDTESSSSDSESSSSDSSGVESCKMCRPGAGPTKKLAVH